MGALQVYFVYNKNLNPINQTRRLHPQKVLTFVFIEYLCFVMQPPTRLVCRSLPVQLHHRSPCTSESETPLGPMNTLTSRQGLRVLNTTRILHTSLPSIRDNHHLAGLFIVESEFLVEYPIADSMEYSFNDNTSYQGKSLVLTLRLWTRPIKHYRRNCAHKYPDHRMEAKKLSTVCVYLHRMPYQSS